MRCVMARLPPNTEIPTHHDTGKWVTASHRVHVAMRTDSNVGFYAGTDPSNMERYFFPIGLPIELNNHAKHAVRNDSDTMYRIHLMFDYVETDLPKTRTRVDLSNRVIRHRRHIEVVRGVRARSARISLFSFTYSEDSLVSLTQPITLSLHCIPHSQ